MDKVNGTLKDILELVTLVELTELVFFLWIERVAFSIILCTFVDLPFFTINTTLHVLFDCDIIMLNACKYYV